MATNTWPMMRRHLRAGSKPRLAVLDLKGLPDPEQRLHDLRVLMNPARVLILSAAGTIPARDIERLGFHTLSRPVVIEEIVIRKHIVEETRQLIEPIKHEEVHIERLGNAPIRESTEGTFSPER